MPAAPRAARERLLEATAQLTYANGITATGVDAIARRAGVTKRTLYQHFPSKDALVGEALAMLDEPTMTRFRKAVERQMSAGSRPVDALFIVLRRTFEQPAFRGCAFLNAGLEMRDAEHPVRAAVRSHTDSRRDFIKELVEAEGVTDELAAAGVSILVEGAFALAASRRDPAALDRASDSAELLLAGARKRS